MEAISTGDSDTTLPFSEAIRHGDTVYVSGQGPIDPDTGEVVGDGASEQTVRTLENVDRILQAAGTSIDSAVKVTLYLDDMADYDRVNAAYGDALSEPYPSRTAVEVVDHPVDISVEIDVIAAVE